MGEEQSGGGGELKGCQPVLGPHAGTRYTRDGQRGGEGGEVIGCYGGGWGTGWAHGW